MRLLRIVGLRLLIAVPVLLIVSIGAFGLVLLIPGDAARQLAGGDFATPEAIALVRERLGFNDPFLTRYWRWLTDAVHLDFGRSMQTGRPVLDDLLQRMPATLSVALFAVVVALIIGFIAGVVSGARPGSVGDKFSVALATIGVSLPSYIIGIILVQLLALNWHLFPATLYVNFGDSKVGWLKSITLPGIALGLLAAGAFSRQLRSGLVDAVKSDYVRTSWAIGSPRRKAIAKHALRNSSIPAVTVFGSQLTFLFGGTVVIESIFTIPGIGTYMFESSTKTDLPAMQGTIMWFALVQLVVYLLIDIILVTINPRVAVR